MPLSQAQAKHFCRRVGFGGKNAELAVFTAMERADAVDYVLAALPDAPSRPPGLGNHDWWEEMNRLRHWWLQRMIDARWHNRTSTTPSPLEEKLTLFWHSHFATGISKVENLHVLFDQHEILRNRSMGNFHTLLDRVCTNGAILVYLDNNQNTRWDLQENFARELMELYTIGPDEFTESDVIEMAKAWTGHGIVGWVGYLDSNYRFRSNDHDNSNKVLFGLPAQNWNGPQTLSIFTSGVRRDATARFLVRKLWRFFVNDEPTEAEIQSIVDAFLPDLVIRDALRAIFNHDAFWDSANEFALTRSPLEFVVDVLRRLGVRAEDTGIHWQMGQLGHVLFEPPSVAGWGTGRSWISTMGSWSRASFLGSLRWSDEVSNQFDHLVDLETSAVAADQIISIMGVPSPSGASRAALEDFWTAHQTRDPWALKHNAVIAGGMVPEMHVA